MTSTALDPLMAALDQVSLLQQQATAKKEASSLALARRVQEVSTALGNPISAELAHQAVARTPAAVFPASPASPFSWNRPATLDRWRTEQAEVEAGISHQGKQAEQLANRAFFCRLASILGGAIFLGIGIGNLIAYGVNWTSGSMVAGLAALMGLGIYLGERAAKASRGHAQSKEQLQDRWRALKEEDEITLAKVERWANLPHALPELYAILTSGVPFLKGDAEEFGKRQHEDNQIRWAREADTQRADTYRALHSFVASQLQSQA